MKILLILLTFTIGQICSSQTIVLKANLIATSSSDGIVQTSKEEYEKIWIITIYKKQKLITFYSPNNHTQKFRIDDFKEDEVGTVATEFLNGETNQILIISKVLPQMTKYDSNGGLYFEFFDYKEIEN